MRRVRGWGCLFRLLPITARHLVLNLLWLSTVPSTTPGSRRREEDSPMSGMEEEGEEEEGRSEITLGEMAMSVRERKSDGGDKNERR